MLVHGRGAHRPQLGGALEQPVDVLWAVELLTGRVADAGLAGLGVLHNLLFIASRSGDGVDGRKW